MLKEEVGAIFAALLLVATLGAGVASAEGVVLGGGYNDTSVDMSSSIFSDFFTTDLWNGSFWDYVAEEGVEEEEEAAAEAEESDSFLPSGDKTSWPAGYWEVDPTYRTHWPAGYWDVNLSMPWP